MIKYLLQHYLEDQVSKQPNKVAVRDGDKSITYRELDLKSNILAYELIESGFEPKNIVGVYINKSIEAIISFFSILKAGGAYVPLEKQFMPIERLSRIILKSEMEYIITDSSGLKAINNKFTDNETFEKMRVLCIDDILAKSINEISINDIYANEPNINSIIDDDIAYILYTSGSTGIPKGVMLTHLNARTFVNWALSYFNPSTNEVFSSHAPFNFDLSVFDIYVSIASGSTLEIVPSAINGNPRALIDWIANKKISYWYSVPSVWISVLNFSKIDKTKLENLKCILFAGEVFPPNFLKKLMKNIPHAAYYNLYGPTETNVCTCYKVPSIDCVGDKPVPIGNACKNTEVIVLKDDDTLAKIGEEGELFVKGSTVTKGYYKDLDKTNEVFRESPYHNNALVYSTGDIVKRCGETCYEYIGRRDLMVKCSGFRVELQEIENVLYHFENINEAVVVPQNKEERGNVSLYAVITLKTKLKQSIIEIKEHCIKYLPYYMVPETIKIVENIPKNLNGKIDRQKLSYLVNRMEKSEREGFNYEI